MKKRYPGRRKKNAPSSKKILKKNAVSRSSEIRIEDQVLDLLTLQKEDVSSAFIVKTMALPGSATKQIAEILNRLERAGKIYHRKNKYRLAQDSDLFKATLDLTSRGFGFAAAKGTGAPEKDIFIAKHNINGALHGDTVLVRVISAAKGRFEGRIVQIAKRGITKLCGIYFAGGKTGHVIPDNDRLNYSVLIQKGNNLEAQDNTAVVVDITDFGTERRNPEGKIIEILGDPYTVPVQIAMALEQFKLTRFYPEQAELQAKALHPLTECNENRKDLRHIHHVTIDGSTAKDFDDAIAVEQTESGFILYVSIADVSHYVQPGSEIDKEAYRRGTSVYLPDLVLPMLPERLSNDLCSLVPDQDRPAFTAILSFNGKGKRTHQTFCKSLIKSQQRFTYDTVNNILYLKNKTEQERYKALLPMLTSAKKLARLLQKTRTARGSIGFNIPEPFIQLKNNKIESIRRAERNQAHQLIEEFMLAANEAVGETLDTARQEVLFRIHERPDPSKVDQFTEAAASLGLLLPKFELSPDWFAAVLKKAVNTPTEYVLNNLLLRTMQQARYSPDNQGHFGLAAQYYLHFTSPIRRYPDLIAHRVLHNFLIGSKNDPTGSKQLTPGNLNLIEAGLHLSHQERISVDIERNVHARLSTLFFKDRVGEKFQAVISGVTPFGLFIELTDYFISGAIPVQEMRDDYYIHDSRGHRLIGDLTAKTHQLGNLVEVQLTRVDMISKKLYFSLDITTP